MDKKDLDMILITLVNEFYDGDIEEAKKHEKEAEQVIDYLENQMNIFKRIQKSQIINNELQFNKETGEAMFEEGTLVHCASKCSYKKIESIKENGILSGDFIGIPESHQVAGGESYFCADFYRAEKPIQAQEFFQRIHKSDDWNRRGPFGNRGANGMTLAFIINPNLQLQELLDTNMYNAENDNHCMQKALKLLDSYKENDENRNKISAIPYGIPSNAVSGIVVGNYLLHSEEYIQALQTIFPNCYILNYEGKVFFGPNLSNEENKKRKEECLAIMPEYPGGYEKIAVDEEIKYLLEIKSKEEIPVTFSEKEIGQTTVNVSTTKKDEAREQTIRDEQQIEQNDELKLD